tara:strand:- start:391 stop:627 length:237 start_codon:yes stop_codon:yes gene_type:complete
VIYHILVTSRQSAARPSPWSTGHAKNNSTCPWEEITHTHREVKWREKNAKARKFVTRENKSKSREKRLNPGDKTERQA